MPAKDPKDLCVWKIFVRKLIQLKYINNPKSIGIRNLGNFASHCQTGSKSINLFYIPISK